jgi:hypothetical protein
MIQSLLIANRSEVAWPFISTARATLRRRPELVSGPMPRWRGRGGCIQSRTNRAAWMLKRVQHDGRVWGNGDEIAWPFILAARAIHRRRPELVSGPMPQWRRPGGCIQPRSNSEAWMLKRVQHDGIRQGRAGCIHPRSNSAAWTLKQVQGDGLGEPSVQHDGGASRSTLYLNQTPFDSQVAPFGVVRFNQVDLPLPVPVFQLLLPRDSVGHPVKRYGVNKADRAIIRRKAGRRARPMLVQPRGEVGRYADVQGAALLAGENVNTGLLHASVGNIQHRHAELVSASMPQCSSETGCSQIVTSNEAWVLKQVQDDGCRGSVSA